jgi:DNA-binding response OmpR family regulator
MSPRILIVDDEKKVAGYLCQILQIEVPQGEVDVAYSGEEALSRLAEMTYDLIIADLRMPGFSGLDLIKGVRYLDEQVPIILMTGYGSESLQREAAAMGATHYIDKPFDIPEMLGVINDLLANRSKSND